MSERIIIEFADDEEKNNEEEKKGEDRIIIDLDETKEKVEVDNIEDSYEEKILKSKVNSFPAGNSHLSNSYESILRFPEGIEQGFRKKFSLNLKDEFFNSVLENNRFIILSSKSGNVYLADRFSGRINDKIFFEYESFEKTGLVYQNTIYVNSLKRIFEISDTGFRRKEIYNSGNELFIWSNLNRFKDNILFMEYSSANRKAVLKLIDTKDPAEVTEFNFDVHRFVSDKICIANGGAYVLIDSNILIYDLEKMTGAIHPLDIKTDENSLIFYLNYRIYITSHLNEIYYLDLPSVNYRFKYSGIKNNYINSIGGFEDNIFMGTLDGWKYYKTNGLSVYHFEDEYENKIESIGKNVLIISKKNKIVFCNLNRFQEAESYTISSNENNESIEIVSAIISHNEIFVLTKNGTLEAFTNDKLNIHI